MTTSGAERFDQHARHRARMAALRRALRRAALRAVALPTGDLCRRTALAVSRPRWDRPGGLALAAAHRGKARRLPAAAAAAASTDRPAGDRRRAAPPGVGASIDDRGARLLPRALARATHPADGP